MNTNSHCDNFRVHHGTLLQNVVLENSAWKYRPRNYVGYVVYVLITKFGLLSENIYWPVKISMNRLRTNIGQEAIKPRWAICTNGHDLLREPPMSCFCSWRSERLFRCWKVFAMATFMTYVAAYCLKSLF